MTIDTQRALLALRGLAEEKSLYVDMFNKGHLSERAFRQLLLTLQLQIDAVRNRDAYQDVPPHRSSLHRLEDAALRLDQQGGFSGACGRTVALASHRDGLRDGRGTIPEQ